MPRNGSGTYSLPEAPFVPNTAILSAEVNSDFDDIADALTGSVATDGQSSIAGPLKAFAGTEALPGYAFATDTDTGIYRIGANNLGVTVGGVKILDVSSTGLSIVGTIVTTGGATIVGNSTITGTLGVSSDFAVNTNKFTVAASTGNTAVAGTLGVTGAITGSSTIAGTDITASGALSGATAAGAMLASQAEMEAASATNKLVAPGTLKYNPGNIKWWVKISQSGGTHTILGSMGVSSISKGGTGLTTINFTNAFSSADNYAVGALGVDGGGGATNTIGTISPATGSVSVQCRSGGTAVDFLYLFVFGMGDLP